LVKHVDDRTVQPLGHGHEGLIHELSGRYAIGNVV
jgi:hypothetical protein